MYTVPANQRTLSTFAEIVGELKERLHKWTRSGAVRFPLMAEAQRCIEGGSYASLPRNNPDRFYDIVVQVAIIRPAPS